jgi:2-methylcitrate dehydratase PrpD
MGATDTLVKFINKVELSDISQDALDITKKHIIDWLATALAGSNEEAGSVLHAYADEISGSSHANIIGTLTKASVDNAAFINGSLGHLLDYDDMGFSHPTTCILPGLLALADKNNFSGSQILLALIIGYEVFEKLSFSARPYEGSLRRRGYHPTSLYGTIAGAAASSKILGLNVQQTKRALGIAGSMASGLSQNFGTWVKGMHGGNSSRAGVVSATLASKGYYADEEILEGDHGFFHAIHTEGNYDIAKVTENLGNPWAIVSPGLSVKQYPCCGGNHRALDAALLIMKENNLNYEQIESLTAHCHPDLINLLRFMKPEKGFNGKFSLDYNMAAAIVFGEVKIHTFSDKTANDPRMREAMESKIIIETHPDWTHEQTSQGTPIVIKTTDGKEYTKSVAIQNWHPSKPISNEEVEGKFRYCAENSRIPVENVEKIIEMIWNLEECTDTNDLTSLCTF